MSKRLLMMVAVIEAIVVALSIAVVQMIDTSANTLSIVIAVFVLLLTAGVLRKSWGVFVGWLVQGYVIVISLQNIALFVLALIFGGIWWWAFRLGRHIDDKSRNRL